MEPSHRRELDAIQHLVSVCLPGFNVECSAALSAAVETQGGNLHYLGPAVLAGEHQQRPVVALIPGLFIAPAERVSRICHA